MTEVMRKVLTTAKRQLEAAVAMKQMDADDMKSSLDTLNQRYAQQVERMNDLIEQQQEVLRALGGDMVLTTTMHDILTGMKDQLETSIGFQQGDVVNLNATVELDTQRYNKAVLWLNQLKNQLQEVQIALGDGKENDN